MSESIAAVCRGITQLEEVRVSFTLHGIPVSRGIAIGRAYLIAPAALDVDHYLIEPAQIESEIERFRAAQQHVHQELDTLRADLAADAPSEMGAFITSSTRCAPISPPMRPAKWAPSSTSTP